MTIYRVELIGTMVAEDGKSTIHSSAFAVCLIHADSPEEAARKASEGVVVTGRAAPYAGPDEVPKEGWAKFFMW